MVTYVTLTNFTTKGAKEIKNFPQMSEENNKRFEELGIEIKDYYLVMGAYDEVVVWTAPSEEVAVTWLLEMGGKGNRETVTLRAFNFEEVNAAIERIP